jgi:hypothetical protein
MEADERSNLTERVDQVCDESRTTGTPGTFCAYSSYSGKVRDTSGHRNTDRGPAGTDLYSDARVHPQVSEPRRVVVGSSRGGEDDEIGPRSGTCDVLGDPVPAPVGGAVEILRGGRDDGPPEILESGCRECGTGSVPGARAATTAARGRTTKENTMKYLLLKHYRGGPTPVGDHAPMDRWTPDEVDAHIQYMNDFAKRLEETGEYVDAQALSAEGAFVRSDGEGRPPVTDGPFAETKDLIAGWMIIDVESWDRAVELAGELSAAPGQRGEPIHEWLEVRPFLVPGHGSPE